MNSERNYFNNPVGTPAPVAASVNIGTNVSPLVVHRKLKGAPAGDYQLTEIR